MASQSNDIRRAIWLSVLMVTLSSTAIAAAKYVSANVTTAAIVTVQFLICTLVCVPRIKRPRLRSLRTERLGLHLLRGLAGALGFYLFYGAVENISLVDAMMLRQSAPLLVPLVLWSWNREKISKSAWLPLVIGFSGIAVILRPTTAELNWWHVAGLLSALGLAISMVATRKLASTEPTARILFYYCLFSLVCMAPLSVGDFDGLTALDWIAMLYIGIAVSVALELYTRAYGMAPTATIAPINYFSVVLAGIWGWLIWDQVPDRFSILGSILVAVGGILTLYFAQREHTTAA